MEFVLDHLSVHYPANKIVLNIGATSGGQTKSACTTFITPFGLFGLVYCKVYVLLFGFGWLIELIPVWLSRTPRFRVMRAIRICMHLTRPPGLTRRVKSPRVRRPSQMHGTYVSHTSPTEPTRCTAIVTKNVCCICCVALCCLLFVVDPAGVVGWVGGRFGVGDDVVTGKSGNWTADGVWF